MIPPLPNNSTTLVLRRTFQASLSRVFRAWIEPKALQHWFRPMGMGVTISQLDVRVGGSFRFEVEDGNTTVGTYLRVAPPEQLIFTWLPGAMPDEEGVVTLDFLEQGACTELVITHERLNTSKIHETFKAGWLSLLSALEEALSSCQ